MTDGELSAERLISPEQLEITVKRPLPGGQHVGIYRGLTITHIPSGISVTVECENSQHRNKAIAIDALLGALTSPHFRGSH